MAQVNRATVSGSDSMNLLEEMMAEVGPSWKVSTPGQEMTSPPAATAWDRNGSTVKIASTCPALKALSESGKAMTV